VYKTTKRAAKKKSYGLLTQETRKKRLARKHAIYFPSSFLLGNRKRAHSSSSGENSRAIDPISPVISKQKRPSNNLEN
jgi:hypothetical protein